MKKNISVYTNDPKAPRFKLTIQGNVEKFVSISPRRVRLAGTPGQKLKAVVSIIPEEKYPFHIVGIRVSRGKHIKYGIEKVTGSIKTVYMLTVENIKTTRGNYFDRIFLDTDSKIKPVITINVSANIREKMEKNKK